ncbi:MAG: GPW/gp25 family protein [Caldilineaceae bacterium]|nr:GPW/gp25 family protein [Caldilineaceae bacterium]MCB0145580.1 GPW/gp25 family protein [Caldilineaceae bacterium]
MNQRWGTDLRLLTNLEQQNERDRGRDLSIVERQTTGQVDLDTLTELDNLRQALLLRFLTPVGELEALGHPDYGSRLFDLIGEPNTPTNRNRAKMYVLQALTQEPRVAEVLSVDVTTRPTDRSRIDIDVRLKPITVDTVLNLVFPFFLEQ